MIEDGRLPGTKESLVVTASVADVEPGISFQWRVTDDGADRIDLPFGDPRAESTSVHLILEVSRVIAPAEVGQSSRLTVGLLFGPGVDLEAIKHDFMQMGEAIFFLETVDAFNYQPDAYSVMENGLLVGAIGPTGTLRFPLLDEHDPLLGPTGEVKLEQLLVEG